MTVPTPWGLTVLRYHDTSGVVREWDTLTVGKVSKDYASKGQEATGTRVEK